MNFFTVDIYTPSKIIAKGVPAESLLIPTQKGQINVLPEHTHLIGQLETGKISVFGGPDDPDRHFSVTKGICKVLDKKVVILSEVSEEDKDINAERAKLALENAQQMLKKDGLSQDEMTKYRRKIERAQLRLQMVAESKK